LIAIDGSTLRPEAGSAAALLALGGAKGPGAVARDIHSLQSRVEELSDLGGEVDESIAGDARLHAQTIATIAFLAFFLLGVALANGAMLNQFFQDLIPGHLLGLRLSYFFSFLAISFEAAMGFLAYHHRGNRLAKAMFISVAGGLALIEAVIFGMMSYGFDLDLPLLDEFPVLKLWLGLFGFLLVIGTAGLGYTLHQVGDEFFATMGAKKLRREAKALNALLRDLPGRWEGIRGKADASAAAIANFQSALGGRAGALAGAVEKIDAERKAMDQALIAARMDQWRTWLDGEDGDRLQKKVQQVGLGLLTVGGFAVFAVAMEASLARAFRNWNDAVLFAAAAITALAYYVIGWLSFERIELLGERVFPLRGGTRQTAAAVVTAGAASIAVLTVGWRVGGTSGVAYALLLIAGGGGLAVLGYFFDDAARGLLIAGRALVAIALGLAALLVAAAAHLFGWPFLAVLGATWLLLTLLAWPLEQLVSRRRSATPVPAPLSEPAPVKSSKPRRRKLQPAA
jgi:hypothetical protein